MTIWRPDLDGRSGPKYKWIADAIGESVADGRLKVGDRLPVQRDLAYELGLSLNTISRAYADATERGFLQGEVGRGTYVRQPGSLGPQMAPSDLARPVTGPIDFSQNLPAPGRSAGALAQTLAELKDSDGLAACMDYQTRGDQVRHAKAAARWLSKVGFDADAENIVMTTGAQHGLMVAMLATMRPGDILLTEELTYGPVKILAQQLGLKVVPVATDEGGLSVTALEAACRRVTARTLYCLPTLHTPTTVTMDAERRAAVASIARKHNLLIVEDDVFGFLPSQRPHPVAMFAPERTIYVTSVSKSLAPGLRVGYLRAPERYTDSLRAAVNLSCWMPPPLMSEITSRWIEDGTADMLNEYQRSEAAFRQALARKILPEKHLKAHPDGFHLWLELMPGQGSEVFRMTAERRGVKVLASEVFAVDPKNAPLAVRLCLSHEDSRERVAKGLETIADLLDEPTDTAALIL